MMARVVCALCGKKVDTTKDNYVFANDIHQHKHCPKSSATTEEDKNDLKILKEAIQWACVRYDKPTNWVLISTQIKELKDMGYSYADQLYALKYLVDVDGEFFGYGRLKKFIAHAMEHRKKEEDYEAKKKEALKQEKPQQLKVTSKPKFLDM